MAHGSENYPDTSDESDERDFYFGYCAGDYSRKLKRMREKVDWENEKDRKKLFRQLYRLVNNWKGELPDLRDIFRPEEIDWLLIEDVKNVANPDTNCYLIYFVARGYNDEPEVDDDGKPILRRTTAVHEAARQNLFDLKLVIDYLFKIYDRFDVNYVDDTGLTHFHAACKFVCCGVVAQFLVLGQDPNTTWTETGDSPLHLALAGGHNKVVELLLKSGADSNVANANGTTPLHIIFQTRCGVEVLAEVFFNINDEVKQLVQVNAQDEQGCTPLHFAVDTGRKKTAEILLRRGADPNLANKEEEMNWLLAHDVKNSSRMYCKSDFIDFVIRTGYKDEPEVDKDGKPIPSRTTAIHHAARLGYTYFIEDLFKIYDSFDVNYVDESGYTHFHAACRYACYEVVEKFFKLGQDPDCLPREPNVDPPLHLALCWDFDFKNKRKVVELLLRYGANPNSVDKNGLAPLQKICKKCPALHGYFESAEIFFEIDKDIEHRRQPVHIDVRDEFGNTPLHMTVSTGHRQLMQLLLNNGANPNSTNVYGWTPLHIICKKENNYWRTKDLAELFLNINDEVHQLVQIDAVDNLGRTPLQWAVANLKSDLVEALLNRGADLSKFVFPTESHFDECIKSLPSERYENKLDLVFRALFIVDQLEKRGYEMDRTALCSRMSDDEDVDTQSDHDDSSSDSSDYPFSFYKNDQCDCYDPKTSQDKLEELRSLREKIDWEVEEERRKLLKELYHVIIHWNERLPNLRDVFRREEIDWLLTEDVKNDAEPYQFYGKLPFVNFAVRTGYKDEPDHPIKNENGGKAALRRATALHYVGRKGPVNRFIVDTLFRIYDRFDVNYIDELDGLTHFHVACELNLLLIVEKFLELGQDPDCLVAQESNSSSVVEPPLHLALRHKHEKMIALLLRHGANPNLGNKDGLTALHVICRSGSDDDFLETFFDMNDANQQTLQIDAVDKLGQTPLQWAVARFMPNAVDRFLDRGADLSGFAYPNEGLFDDYIQSFLWHSHKLQLACTTLIILVSLEKRGYELDHDGASTIMKVFAKLELLIESVDLDDSLRRDEDFRRRAKRLKINPRLSLHDSILWRPEEAAKLLTTRDYCRFENSPKFWKHRKQLRDTYTAHLFEILSRRFFRRWGLEFFLQLTRYRLPILCCEMIVERTKNRDLFNVCLVATGLCKWNEKQA
ncbi:unnamed protein product [Trichogramma brassicae]|uniref:Uncharacterized protein n=1 Tax=Trichogramma brassicae TaxID=86971 RepID=A0A6H5J9F5_9HYME|nr:unnamed protein product [Trichogramma brassicae]